MPNHPNRSKTRSLDALLDDAKIVRKICRQMCAHDEIDPDEPLPENPGFKNWELHVADVNAVLRAIRAIAS
jgi:hypothetical protein